MVKQFKIARERQDEFALDSHRNAAAVRNKILPHLVFVGKANRDTLIREDSSIDALAKLPPVFDRSKTGTITAGNSSPFTDGAAALYVISPAVENEVLPDAYLADYEFVGVEPKEGLLMGPGKAMLRLMQRNKLHWTDLDYIEIHEAFAGQALCNIDAVNRSAYRQKIYGVDYDPGFLDEVRINPWGSSIAYGHPFGATGARMLNQSIAYLQDQQKRRALIGICTAGGLGGAALVIR